MNLIYGESDWSKQDEKLNTMKALGLNSFHTMKSTGHFSFLESPKKVSESNSKMIFLILMPPKHNGEVIKKFKVSNYFRFTGSYGSSLR